LYLLVVQYALDYVWRRRAVMRIGNDEWVQVQENHTFEGVQDPPVLSLDQPACYDDFEQAVPPTAARMEDDSSEEEEHSATGGGMLLEQDAAEDDADQVFPDATDTVQPLQ